MTTPRSRSRTVGSSHSHVGCLTGAVTDQPVSVLTESVRLETVSGVGGDVAARHRRQSAGQRAELARPPGPVRRPDAGGRRRRQGDRRDLRRSHVHRRCRHQRVRRGDAGRQPAAGAGGDGGCPGAGDRRDPRHRARRRARGRAVRPLPGRVVVGEVRPARGEPRPAPRRRRHPAPPPPGRRADGARDDDVGSPHQQHRGARQRSDRRRDGRRPRRTAHRRRRVRQSGGHREPPAEAGPRSRRQGRSGQGRHGAVRQVPPWHRAQVPRLPRSRVQRPVHRGGGQPAVRRGPEGRAEAVHRARHRAAVRRPALRVLRRAGRQQDPRHRQGHADHRHPDLRRARRRHDGRRHRHELRQRRHPGDDRRTQPGGARQGTRRRAQELRALRVARLDPGRGGRAADGAHHRARPTRPTSPRATS